MRCFIGIDLGSTTTKAVVIDEDQNILGRGITNSRSNYDTAAAIAKQEALVNSRFHLFRQALAQHAGAERRARRLPRPARARLPLRAVPRAARRPGGRPASAAWRRRSFGDATQAVATALTEVFRRLHGRGAGAVRARRQAQVGLLPRHRRQPVPRHRRGGGQGSRHALRLSCSTCSTARSSRSRTASTATRSGATCWRRWSAPSSRCPRRRRAATQVEAPIKGILDTELEETYVVGTGYGRARLPFSKEHIRSRDPVPRPGRARDVPGHGDGARHRRPGHQGDPGRPGTASSRASR